MGTNDAKGKNWNEEKYVTAFAEFVKIFQGLDSKPTVYMMSTTPFLEVARKYDENCCEISNNTLPALQPQMAKDMGVTFIDIYTSLTEKFAGGKEMEFMTDAIHPNAEGYKIMA